MSLVLFDSDIIKYKTYIFSFVVSTSVVSVMLSIAFAVEVLDPGKYRFVAQSMLREMMPLGNSQPELSVGIFIKQYNELENLIDKMTRESDKRLSKEARMISPRMGLLVLRQDGVIKDELLEEAAEIVRYRNLAVHGQLELVDKVMIDRLSRVLEALKKVRPKTER